MLLRKYLIGYMHHVHWTCITYISCHFCTTTQRISLNLSKATSPVFVWEKKYLFFRTLYIQTDPKAFQSQFLLRTTLVFSGQYVNYYNKSSLKFCVRYSKTIDSKPDIFELLCNIFQRTKQMSHYKLAIWTFFHLFNFKQINI